MRVLVCALALLMACGAVFARKNNQLTRAERQQGFVLLFDGKSLLGWTGDTLNYKPAGEKRNPYTLDHHSHPGLLNPRGHIGFLGHGEGLQLRNIRIKEL